MPRRSSPRLARLIPTGLLLGGLLACVACSGGLNPTSGKVTYKGKAIAGAVVVFVPRDAKEDSLRPSGVTKEDGTYTLSTGTKEGARAGEYVVTITWTETVTKKPKTGKISMQDEEVEIRDRLQGRYADPAKSTIQATIKRGGGTIPTFELD